MNQPNASSRFRLKGFTSLLLTLAFVVLAISGSILYVAPHGRVARWNGWTIAGLSKDQWGAVHMVVGLLFLIAAILHLYLNWATLWGYLRNRLVAGVYLKREMTVAVAVMLVVLVGTYYEAPPFGQIVKWNDAIKNYWERVTARAPLPHAEQLRLDILAGHLGLPVDKVVDALRLEGFGVEDPTAETIAELAVAGGCSPADVFAAIRKRLRINKRTTASAGTSRKRP